MLRVLNNPKRKVHVGCRQEFKKKKKEDIFRNKWGLFQYFKISFVHV